MECGVILRPAVREKPMLKVAIVGCGKIADSHAEQIVRIPGCEIVGVCDREPLMAQQLYERFPVKAYYSDVTDLIENAKPDVVHITTPPQSHYQISTQCLDAGCHVYVEKPFALNAAETVDVIRLAERKGLKITAGHDDQFRPATRRMRALIRSGFLGEAPVHMESYYGYEISTKGYAGALLGDKQHWVRKLPGKLLHNIISHGIARISEFLTSDSPETITYGFTSPQLRSVGESEIVDELRVIISEDRRTTAYFTFSSQMRPLLHQFRVYGSKNGLILDQDQETLVRLRGKKFKSYGETFVAPVVMADEYLKGSFTNLRLFAARDFHMKSGMKYLIEAFYRAIVEGAPDPIPSSEILRTARIMDAIFAQLQMPAASAMVLEEIGPKPTC
jgi:predicted dehydrogenase